MRLPTELATGDITTFEPYLAPLQPLTTSLVASFAIFSTVPEPAIAVLYAAVCAAIPARAQFAGRARWFARSTSPRRSEQHSRV